MFYNDILFKRGGVAVFVAGDTMAALVWGVLASADRHGTANASDVGKGLGDGAPVVASDVGVVPGGISQGAGAFFQDSVASEGGGSPVSIVAVGSVFYL